ncbi:peptide ABC transporter permease [Sinomonas cyclohexanicum]|uniref:Peptide ABC transporter permease n=1 Tax=Sinomonas cyclohexanicum TaxID=322009 RepID=A0ABM7Q150_SINCY|nr:ABC transporter permease [Corynebacterium cyclohexanicum]BCT78298.1 peptide ABC transporter permease [Corynebacterium cyclohexanicum]
MILEAVRFALTGIWANKMRSVLTTLGIVIGISAVITLLAVGAGTSNMIKDQIGKLGTNVLTVNRSVATGGRTTGGSATATRTRSTFLTAADQQSLDDPVLAPDVSTSAPVVQAQSVTATLGTSTHSISSTLGTTPPYFGITAFTAAAGRVLDGSDAGQRVVVLGNSVAADLAQNVSTLVGQTVSLNSQNFTVVGVLAPKGTSGLNDPDDVAMVPIDTAEGTFTGYTQSLSSIAVQAKSADVMTEAQNEIQQILDARHQVTADTRDYQVRNQAQVLSTATSTTQTLTILLSAVAGISLLVGGIGVMNIMLVTVTERTREIGIRKAIGASRGNIVLQFLVESLIISILGGVAGILIGFGASSFQLFGIQPEVQWWTVWLSVAVSAGIGLVFGIYPANKAAKLRPIDALRYE